MANGGSNSIHDPDNSCTKHKTASEKRIDYKISRIGKLKQEKDPGVCPNANFLILLNELHSFGFVYLFMWQSLIGLIEILTLLSSGRQIVWIPGETNRSNSDKFGFHRWKNLCNKKADGQHIKMFWECKVTYLYL